MFFRNSVLMQKTLGLINGLIDEIYLISHWFSSIGDDEVQLLVSGVEQGLLLSFECGVPYTVFSFYILELVFCQSVSRNQGIFLHGGNVL